MKDDKAILEPEEIYHVYNRTNGHEPLFLNKENYHFFLERLRYFALPVVDVLAYCLMPNHFHLLIRVKSEKNIRESLKGSIKPNPSQDADLQGFQNLEGLISQQFSNMFNSYAKAFNKQYAHKGSLFMHTFKRQKVTQDNYLIKLIHYIHFNPVQAGLVEYPADWTFSSYAAIISSKLSSLIRSEVISLFDGCQDFITFHQNNPELNNVKFD